MINYQLSALQIGNANLKNLKKHNETVVIQFPFRG